MTPTIGTTSHSAPTHRDVYSILSPHSLPYASHCLQSLLDNCADNLSLTLLTDSPHDADQLRAAMHCIAPDARHTWQVLHSSELDTRESVRFAGFPHLRAFRHGHPCWRKITDPLLLAEPGGDMVLLDPDLYFPNRFCFQPTPAEGILLMWQQPNCLLPAQLVQRALAAGIPLARHVDIGVAQWRAPSDSAVLRWLDTLLATLGEGAPLPRVMHVEAIVWSALAMHCGGGHLHPGQWVCWRRSQLKRIRRKLGASGRSILAGEPWRSLKCFHGGGESKWWIPEYAATSGIAADLSSTPPGPLLPFVPLSSARFKREQMLKHTAKRLGYYSVLGAHG